MCTGALDRQVTKVFSADYSLRALSTFDPASPLPMSTAGFTGSGFQVFSRAKIKGPEAFTSEPNIFVHGRRLELPYPCGCYHLKVVRLPVSPPVHGCIPVLCDSASIIYFLDNCQFLEESPRLGYRRERNQKIPEGIF